MSGTTQTRYDPHRLTLIDTIVLGTSHRASEQLFYRSLSMILPNPSVRLPLRTSSPALSPRLPRNISQQTLSQSRLLRCPFILLVEAVLTNSIRKLRTQAQLESLTRTELGLDARCQKGFIRRQVRLQSDMPWMPHARNCDQPNTNCTRYRSTQTYPSTPQTHPLSLPVRQSPGEHQGKLQSRNILVALGLALCMEDRHPATPIFTIHILKKPPPVHDIRLTIAINRHLIQLDIIKLHDDTVRCSQTRI